MRLIPVRKGEIDPAKPLPWTLYDALKRPMYERGKLADSPRKLEYLIERGLYRDEAAVEAPLPPPEEAAPAQQVSLDSIRMQIGDPMQLQSKAADGARHYVRLIGYVKGVSVLVTTPVVDGRVMLMREGQDFVVRTFCGKHAYAFSAQVAKVLNVPYPYLHLSYPAEVEAIVVRRFPRVEVDIAAAVGREAAGAQALPATIANLSAGGALLYAPAALGKVGDVLFVRFGLRLNDADTSVVVKAALRAIGPGADGAARALAHGVQFIEVPQQELLVLTAYIYRRMLEQSVDF